MMAEDTIALMGRLVALMEGSQDKVDRILAVVADLQERVRALEERKRIKGRNRKVSK
jgi:hypothetical protein